MNIPEGQTLTGPQAPEWMATTESIDAASQVYREKVPAYMDAHDGHAVLGWHRSNLLMGMEDRSTGVVFRLFDRKQEIGSVIKLDVECVVNGQPSHIWPSHVKVIRRADISEVRRMARLGVGLRPESGNWYEVHSD